MNRVGTWIETKNHKIVEVIAEENSFYFGVEIDESETNLRYGSPIVVNKEDIIDDDF